MSNVLDLRSDEGRAAWASAMRLLSARVGTRPPGSPLYDQEFEAILQDDSPERRALLTLVAMTEIAWFLLLGAQGVEVDQETGVIHGRNRVLDSIDAHFESQLFGRGLGADE
jgi:hypothetical protein